MRLLLVHGEGIGNIVQVLPLLRTLEVEHEVEVRLASASFDVPPTLFQGRAVYLPGDEIPKNYDGKVMTIWGSIHDGGITNGIKLLNDVRRQQMRVDQSEVDVYLNIARDLGIPDSRFVFDCPDDLTTRGGPVCDVVLANGYNWKSGDLWKPKSWRGFSELARRLRAVGVSVCSVGHPSEHVVNSENLTGMSLEATLGIVKRARVLVSNDTGMYHCGCALGTPTIVIFTFTSVVKNYDRRFHKTAKVVAMDELGCRGDCHAKMRWKECPDQHRCRDVDADKVYGIIEKMLSL